MDAISINFQNYPATPVVTPSDKLNSYQIRALESLPPYVDKLNLYVDFEGHHLLIKKATSQYYDNQKHQFSNEIPMTYDEINDMIYHNYKENIDEFLTNRIDENG